MYLNIQTKTVDFNQNLFHQINSLWMLYFDHLGLWFILFSIDIFQQTNTNTSDKMMLDIIAQFVVVKHLFPNEPLRWKISQYDKKYLEMRKISWDERNIECGYLRKMFGAAWTCNKFSRSFSVQLSRGVTAVFTHFGAAESVTSSNSNFQPTNIKFSGAGPINLLGHPTT